MITVPVLIQHNHQKIIGHMTVDETQLPQFPDYYFALGYMVEEYEMIKNRVVPTKIKLMEISVVPDSLYKPYIDRNNE